MALALFKARSPELQLIGQSRWPSRLTQRLNLTDRTLTRLTYDFIQILSASLHGFQAARRYSNSLLSLLGGISGS